MKNEISFSSPSILLIVWLQNRRLVWSGFWQTKKGVYFYNYLFSTIAFVSKWLETANERRWPRRFVFWVVVDWVDAHWNEANGKRYSQEVVSSFEVLVLGFSPTPLKFVRTKRLTKRNGLIDFILDVVSSEEVLKETTVIWSFRMKRYWFPFEYYWM